MRSATSLSRTYASRSNFVTVPGPRALSMRAYCSGASLLVQLCGLHSLSCRRDPRLQLCVGHVTSNTLQRNPARRQYKRRADDLGGTLLRGPRGLLRHFSRIALELHHGAVINCDTGSEQIGIGDESTENLLVAPELSVRRVADAWHDISEQVNSQPPMPGHSRQVALASSV